MVDGGSIFTHSETLFCTIYPEITFRSNLNLNDFDQSGINVPVQLMRVGFFPYNYFIKTDFDRM